MSTHTKYMFVCTLVCPYILIVMYLHIHKHTENCAVYPDETCFLWDVMVVTTLAKSTLATVCQALPRDSGFLPLIPSSSEAWALGTDIAARTLGPCCCWASGNPSTGLPLRTLHSATCLSASGAQAPALPHFQFQVS